MSFHGELEVWLGTTPGVGDGAHGAKYFAQQGGGAAYNPGISGSQIVFGSTGMAHDATIWDTDGFASSGGFAVPNAELEGLYRVDAQGVGSGLSASVAWDGTNIDNFIQVAPTAANTGLVYLRNGVLYTLRSGGGTYGFLTFAITYVCPLPASWTAP